MIEDIFNLKGKTALVVGASKGLGKAMSLALSSAGADLALASRSTSLIKEISDDIKTRGGKAFSVTTDIVREDDIERMTKTVIDEYGKIDVLVNNAGIYIPRLWNEVTSEDWDNTFNINLKGLFLTCKMVGKHMIKRKSGKIINIASILGKRVAPTVLAYSASKAGLIQLTRSLAFELSTYNINVNAIAPGWFETEMVEEELANPKARKYLLSRTPLGRFGQAEELGGTVIYLASKASDFMTGETIYIDGGISIKI